MAEVFPALFDFGPQVHRFAWSEKPLPQQYPAEFSARGWHFCESKLHTAETDGSSQSGLFLCPGPHYECDLITSQSCERSQVTDKVLCRSGCSVSQALTEARRHQITITNE